MKPIFRAKRTRAKIHGTSERPRLSINISNAHITAQLIDDDKGTTLAYATTVGSKIKGTKTEKCAQIGAELGKKAKKAGIKKAVFDRGSIAYAGAYLNFRYFSDGCFVSAVLFAGMGCLFWVSTTGFFDIFSYGFKSLLVLFSPLKRIKEHPHYYEYKCEKDAKREGKPLTHTTLFVGIGMVALSLICLALYYNLMPAH